jgi:hypothetical protein
MPSLLSNPEAEALEFWNLAQWNQALFVHFFASPHTAQAINRLHVTAESLRTASGTTDLSAERVRTLFIQTVRKAIARRSLGHDAESRANHWSVRADEVPPFLSHLLLTCMVANDLADELKSEGDFRKRLTTVLKGGVHHGLPRLRPLWELLAEWLSDRHDQDSHVATLRLPPIPISGHHSIIGYPLRLSVPTRRDQNLLAGLLAKNNQAGDEPAVLEVVTLFQTRSTKFSPLFRDLYREFVDGMKKLSRTTLAQMTFWIAVREIALSTSSPRGAEHPAFKTRVEMEDEDGHFWLYVTCDHECTLKGYECISLPAIRTSSYRYALRSQSGAVPLADQAFLRHHITATIQALLRPLIVAVADGVVLFVEDEDNVSTLTPNIPSSGRLCAIVSDRVSAQLQVAFSKSRLRAEITKSRYPGWSEWRDFTAEDLQQIDFSQLAAFSRVGSLKRTLPLAQIRLRGGIRAGDSYVSMPGSLPSIEIPDADRVALHLQGGAQLDLAAPRSPTDGWTFPDDMDYSRLVGQNRLAAYLSSVQIAERIVSFVGDVLETRYKRPSTNGRWFAESGLSDVSTFEHEDSLVPWSLDRYSTFSFAQEIRPPRPTADYRRLNAAITKVAAALASQRGMSESELAISLTESFGVPWFAVWPILRAWVESGLLDCLVDLRWRARFYFGREPLLVAYHNPGTLTAALTGLVPVYLRQRFKEVATSLRLEIAERRSPSPEVPSLPSCRAKSVDQLVSLTRELELPEVRWLRGPTHIVNSVRKVMRSHLPEPEHWPVYKRWDWRQLTFTDTLLPDAMNGVTLHWCRRDDGPDCYKLYQGEALAWWTRSRTWGTLAAMTLAGMPAFRVTPSGDISCVGNGVYLPLPLARFLAVVGLTSPGPVKNRTSEEYQYFPSNPALAEAVLRALYPSDIQESPELSKSLKRLLAACLTTPGESVPVPAALDAWLRQFRRSRASAAPRRVPLSLLPQFYAYLRASVRRTH